FGMASSVWLTALGRSSLRANEVPAFEALGLAVLWRATETGRKREYALAGAILGSSLYTYLAARFIPFLLVIFAIVCLIVHRSWMISKLQAFVIAAAAAIAVLLPLGYYAIRHPTVFLGRPDQVALPGGAAFLPALVDSTVRTLGMIVVRGDVTWRHNFSNAPVFDPVNGVLFFVGLAVALRRHRPGDLLIVTMLVTMLLPGMLSIESPHFLRTIGATPALYTLWAIGLVAVVRFVVTAARRFHVDPLRVGAVSVRVGAIFVAAILCWTATRDVWTYFVAYARDPGMPGYYNVKLVAAGKLLASDPLWKTSRDNVYITDVYTDSIGSLAYWVYPNMTTEEKANWVDESSLGTYFPQSELIPLPVSPSLYLLSPDAPTNGIEQALGTSIQKRRDLSDGQHSLGSAFWADPMTFPDTSMADFGMLALESASAVPDVTGSVQPDSGRWTLTLRWRVLRKPSYAPSVFVHVDDDRGHTIAQADQQLRLSLDHWKVGQRLVSIRSIVLPAGTSPGQYSVSIGVYDKESGQRETVTVGEHPVVPPTVATIDLTTPVAGTASVDVPIGTTVAKGLTLVGADRWPSTVAAGEKLPLALTWQSVGSIPTDDEVTVSLRQADGSLVGSATAPIGTPVYP
ncbi:MAG TPA: hypothetical protein VKT80_19210, partial [Chloroflexota bacterium]|nr:hypothetical protein [Chloroflexota bacterium]